MKSTQPPRSAKGVTHSFVAPERTEGAARDKRADNQLTVFISDEMKNCAWCDRKTPWVFVTPFVLKYRKCANCLGGVERGAIRALYEVLEGAE